LSPPSRENVPGAYAEAARPRAISRIGWAHHTAAPGAGRTVRAGATDISRLDARTGALLRKTDPDGPINSGPMTCRVGTRQYLSVIAGLSMCTFGLDD
jgi:hypothetical protein